MEKTPVCDGGTGSARHTRNSARLFGRFCIVGVAAFLVNASLVELLAHSLGLGGAQIIAFPTAATTAWWLNRRYTFGASERSMSREWIRYMYANSIGWFLNNATYCVVVAHLQLAQSNPCLAVAAGSIAGLTANFALSHHLVFKKK